MDSGDKFSKTRIDKLGDRLRKGDIGESELRSLDGYRRSFIPAYDKVLRELRDRLSLEPTGRPAKSTTSIIAKLRRETIRLSQMQDIAGCRIVVANLLAQDEAVARLAALFNVSIDDRRERPSHGYRAVHVIANVDDKLIEIQVRTTLQHRWAELSEKISDLLGAGIKYGQGNSELVALLAAVSHLTMEADLRTKAGEAGDSIVKSVEELSELIKTLADLLSHLEVTK